MSRGLRRSGIGAWIVAACVLAAPAGAGAPAATRPLLDTTRDVRIDRAYVPSADRRQGEVRIVRRDGRAVVQTILYTKVPKRVIAAIADKERRNWPAERPGHADMQRYVEALEARARAAGAAAPAGASLPAPPAPGPSGPAPPAAAADRRQRLLIEFVDDPHAPFVAIGGVRLDENAGEMMVGPREPPQILELAPDYVRRNMRLIVADALKVSEEEAAKRLARASAP